MNVVRITTKIHQKKNYFVVKKGHENKSVTYFCLSEKKIAFIFDSLKMTLKKQKKRMVS
jgi:hypothetical protein